MLKKNLAPVEGKSVSLYNFAVGNPELTRLHLGRNNCGEASFYDIGDAKAHIVKIDTEGSEVDILERLGSFDHDVILLEYHSEANRRTIDALLGDFFLVGGEVRHLHRYTYIGVCFRPLAAADCAGPVKPEQAPNSLRAHLDSPNPNPYMQARIASGCGSRPLRGCSSVG